MNPNNTITSVSSHAIQRLIRPVSFDWPSASRNGNHNDSSLSKFRIRVQSFVKHQLDVHTVFKCEQQGGVDKRLLKASYDAGLYAIRAPVEYGGTPPTNPDSSNLEKGAADHIDSKFEYILVYELSSCGSHGLVTELLGNFGMLLPLIEAFASDELKKSLIPDLVQANKFACFAFTERPNPNSPAAATKPIKGVVTSSPPSSPSPSTLSVPVAARPKGPRMKTSAVPEHESSEHLIVTGEKTYISFAVRSDYILTAVSLYRDSQATSGGALSLILVPAKAPGVTISPMQLVGWRASSTCRIRFDRVRVSKRDVMFDGNDAGPMLLLKLRQLLQANVTQERLVTAIMCLRSSRICLEQVWQFVNDKSPPAAASKSLPPPAANTTSPSPSRPPNAPPSRPNVSPSSSPSSSLAKSPSAPTSKSSVPRPPRRLMDDNFIRQSLGQMASIYQQNQLLLQVVIESCNDNASSQSSNDKSNSSSKSSLAQQIALVKYACHTGLKSIVEIAGTVLGSGCLEEGPQGAGALVERIARDCKVVGTTGGSAHSLLQFATKAAKL